MKNIFFIGLVSFFTDFSTEMVYPLIPLYLSTRFGATPALIGLIEGIAESLASLLKVYSGYISDRFQKKKRLAFFGYSTGIVYKVALLLAASWLGILGARVIDRIGKGIRTSPRDVMVSESADEKSMGKAFGLHKALDMAGAALGILFTYIILKSRAGVVDYNFVFILSIIPAMLGLFMFLFIKEKKREEQIRPRELFWKNIKQLDGQLKLYLMVVAIFTLGNSSNTFLLLKAKSIGFENTSVILLYFIYTVTASFLSLPMGKLSDRIGRKRVLVTGYFVYTVVYFGFAFAVNKPFLIVMFILYGAYTAMIAGVERAFIAEIAPTQLKGTMLGMHSTLVGVALLPASVITGTLWNLYGDRIPFIFGGVLSACAAVILLFLMKGRSYVKIDSTLDK